LPGNIAVLLYALGIMLGFGRHLLATLQRRAAAPHFSIIAVCFGTSKLATIIAHLNRGILRATALERMLLARAATGRDVTLIPRRSHDEEPPPAPAAAQSGQPTGQPAGTPRPALRRTRRHPGCNDPEFFMPTLEELDRQVRRRPIGHTIAAICLDLAVVPDFCNSRFWNKLLEVMYCFGGGVVTVMKEKHRRAQVFADQQARIPDSDWSWADATRDLIRQVLGFFIGEPPVDPFADAPTPGTAAVATGPP
jgi:hypothetical protein